jgi:L-ascorbate metabolism protein UlaG (beta-lactamase superfamily)
VKRSALRPATRRALVRSGGAAVVAVITAATVSCQSFSADVQDDVVVTPIQHSSLQLEYDGTVVHVDPWSEGDYTSALRADVILITDTPGHHLDPAAIEAIREPGAPVIMPAAGLDRVPDGVVLENGESGTYAGVLVEAIPAYDLTPGEPYHPKGEANGYLIVLGGRRILIAGVGECVPELRSLQNIDIAFIPTILPQGRMSPAAAAECVKAIRPRVVYPYHYRNDVPGDVEEFRTALSDESIEVRIGGFYPE